MTSRFTPTDIRHYYDRHTRAFLRYGQGGGAGVIHRAVWGPGATTREQAFHDVDDLIADRARSLAASPSTPLHVVDLGCGVGATLCRLAEQLPAMRGTGVTPGLFFNECARLIRPAGLLIIVDDVRRPGGGDHAARSVERFCRGWRSNTLLDRDELQTLAGDAGFEHDSTTDLTPMLEIGRLRDRAIGVLAALLGALRIESGRFGYLVGGCALQQCLERRWIGYDFSVFRRAG